MDGGYGEYGGQMKVSRNCRRPVRKLIDLQKRLYYRYSPIYIMCPPPTLGGP